MRVLVTGATGFVGSHLLPKLQEAGHETYSISRYVTGRYFQGPDHEANTIFCDLRDHVEVRRVVAELQPDAVIHLAAVTPGAYSYEHPHEVLEINFLATVNLADSCLRDVPNLKQFLYASSSETYGNGPVPKTELTLQSPHTPYSVAKFSSEKYLMYLFEAFRFPMTIMRPFNTYGRKSNHHFVVESAIVQMLGNHTLKMGDSEPKRDFIYIDDHVEGYLCALGAKAAIGEAFNLCTGRSISILELVEVLRDLTGFRGNVTWNAVPRRPLDVEDLQGDGAKAARILRWKPKVALRDGLVLTINHWRSRLTADAVTSYS